MSKLTEQTETMFSGWPVGIPRPTIEEYHAAELRYKKSIHENDFSDYGSGLSFVMSTYSPFVWLPFFSCDRKEGGCSGWQMRNKNIE